MPTPPSETTPEPSRVDAPLQLVFSGECLDGHEPQAVRRAVAEALKLDEKRAARLFSGRRVVVRRDVDVVAAHRYIARFALMGALLRAEPSSPRPPRPPRPVTAASAPQARPATPASPPPVSARAPWPQPLRRVGSGVLFTVVSLLLAVVLLRGLDALWPETRPPGAATASLPEANPPAPPTPTVAAAGAVPVTVPVAPASPQPMAPEPAPQDMTAEAQREYRSHYLPAPDHKAFAISFGGAHAWHAGAGSENEARERAIANCVAALRPGDDGCRIVDADGHWEE